MNYFYQDIRALLSHYSSRIIWQKMARLYGDKFVTMHTIYKQNGKIYVDKYEISKYSNKINILFIYKKYVNIRHCYHIHRWNSNIFVWLYTIEYGDFCITRGDQYNDRCYYTIIYGNFTMYIYSNCIILKINGKKYKYDNYNIYELIRDHFREINQRKKNSNIIKKMNSVLLSIYTTK